MFLKCYRIFIISCLAVSFTQAIASIAYSSDRVELFSGFPPQGENYYTACLACCNLDKTTGEELIITDDSGSFQILSWNANHLNFEEIWVSDPVFEFYRVTEIFTPPSHSDTEKYIMFVDSSDDVQIFRSKEYIVSKTGVIHLNAIPQFKLADDFVVGDFDKDSKGWEFVSIRTGRLRICNHILPYGLISTGVLDLELNRCSSYILMNVNSESCIQIDHRMQNENQGIVILSDNGNDDQCCKIFQSESPFNKARLFQIDSTDVLKTGWTGEINNSKISYLTCLKTGTQSTARLSFFKLDHNPETDFSVPVSYDVSKWVLGDLDGDGHSELIILDFVSKLHVIEIRNFIPGAES